jgi:hypothetical protein
MARLTGGVPPAGHSFALQSLPSSTDSVSVTLRNLGSAPLTTGFSSGRVAAHHFEIESTGYVARGVRMTLVQGAVRVLPVAPPVVAESRP